MSGRSLIAVLAVLAMMPGVARAQAVRVQNGYEIRRLALPPDVLPSCLAVMGDGTLLVGSMDGDVHRVVDTDGDGVPDQYRRWAGTLPHWPLGMMVEGDDVVIATKAALLRLADADRDGWAERWTTITDAWDVTRDHHDWTTGIARWPGAEGGYVVAPATDDVRAKDVKGRHHLRGKALRVGTEGEVTVLAEGLRYATGWGNWRDGLVLFTDNQGQQKTTCELNVLETGTWYGYPSQADEPQGPVGLKRYAPAVRIPYPWARSVNGLATVDAGGRFGPIDGQVILCEYNQKFLLRASLQKVGGAWQGASYPLVSELLGPIAVAFAPDGTLHVASLREPAWAAEPEQGAIYRIRRKGGETPWLAEVKAEPGGFAMRWSGDVSGVEGLLDPERYAIRSYRHVFAGAYHSPPVDERAAAIEGVARDADGSTIHVRIRDGLIADRIYEIRVSGIESVETGAAWYTMNRVPVANE